MLIYAIIQKLVLHLIHLFHWYKINGPFGFRTRSFQISINIFCVLYRDHRRLWNICSTLSNNQRELIFGEGGNLNSRTKTKNLMVFADNTANVIASQLLLILKKVEYVQLTGMNFCPCFYPALCFSLVPGR